MRATIAALFLCLAACSAPLNPVDTSDPGILARVKAELKADPDIDVRYVDVNVNAGVVTISGMVESVEQRTMIRRKLGRLRGVKQLIVNVLIQE